MDSTKNEIYVVSTYDIVQSLKKNCLDENPIDSNIRSPFKHIFYVYMLVLKRFEILKLHSASVLTFKTVYIF